ncbi:ABC transporter permease [Aquiflexum sp. TKW24L]|uniref:ABC transporter permease n=1 Tax=Aquiflexum sp. TKW24L TaxID=2942212 RepID=UPI0020C12164|nr:ABC transporter permease [Aquiflexum sp. TKW24L]MCL6258316.1 ABC transporter permease [Aquiflexum sp. TKW24L]
MYPPKKALAFLRWFCREDYLDEIEGDLRELFENRYSNLSPSKAKWKFTWDVIRSFRLRNIKKFDISHFIYPIMFQHYAKIGGRHLLRNKAFSAINIFGLSVGIACCLSLLVFVEYESSFDNFHPYATRSYRIVQHTKYPDQTLYWNTTAYPLAEALRADFHEFEMVTQTAGPFQRFFTVDNGGKEEFQFESDYVLFVDPFYPKAFDLTWLAGDKNSAFQLPNSIVLTESIAEKFFGKYVSGQSILGKTIMLAGKDPLQVTGLVRDVPGNSTLRYEMLVPYEFFRQNNPYPASNWSGNYGGTTFVVASEQHELEEIESSISSWKKKYLNEDDDSRISYKLQPLATIHTETLYGNSPGSYLMPNSILQTARYVGIFILLIAIGNFVNLMTAKSVIRAKEVGIRKTIGSTRFDLFKQFTLENSLLVAISVLLALVFSVVLINEANSAFSVINLQLKLNWTDLGLVAVLGGVTVLLGTAYPALFLSAFKPLQIIKNDLPIARTRGLSMRKAVTVFQFAIVQLFVIATIIAAVQMDLFRNKSLGFSSEAVLMLPVPQSDKVEIFKNQLEQNPDIKDIAIGSGPPMAVNGFQLGTRFRTSDMPEENAYETELKIGDTNYLDFYELDLIAGRNFSGNKANFDEFIVNERLLKLLGWTPEDAIGRKITINEGEATVIGVAKDYHNNSLQHDISPCIIVNWDYFQDQAFIKISDLNPQVLQSIEKSWKDSFTTSEFKYEFVDESIAREYFVEALSFKGFTLFSIIAIVIGSLGLIGLMTFITTQRTKEVGIRKVLGATVTEIVLFFSKEFTLLIGIAFVLAMPFAYFLMQHWLEDFTYRIEMSWWMFLFGGLITLLVAVLSSGFQATKAALANPIKSIKTE